MQWLASICVRRPVFASVLILTLTVVGAFSFGRLGVDRFPKIDFPTIVDHDAPAGRDARAGGDRDQRQDRGSRQHHQRHRRAAIDVGRGRLARRRVLPARQGRRRRGAGSARPRQPRAAAAAAERRPADGGEARPRRGADPDARGLVEPPDPRRHGVRRQGAAPATRERERRGPGARARRPSPPGQRVAGCRRACGPTT